MNKRNVLSTREEQMLQLLAQGYTRRNIAANLRVSVGTVHATLRKAYLKLGAASKREAITVYQFRARQKAAREQGRLPNPATWSDA